MRPITFINSIAVLALAACYVILLVKILGVLHVALPQPASSLQKVGLTGASSVLACAAIFTLNHYVTRKDPLWVGLACSAAAYGYFYVFNVWPHIYIVISVFMTPYSLFTFLGFVILPGATGAVIRRQARLKPVVS